jgi:SAM-dependent methyltransferase
MKTRNHGMECIPPEFDAAIYGIENPDLGHLNARELEMHWLAYGQAEGRRANRLANRSDFVNLIPKTGKVLEIGPFNAPLRRGPQVKYLDILDREGLVARARKIGLDVSSIPTINYVSQAGDVASIDETFDFVVSSHVFEHQPNPIRHLQDVYRLLNDGGFYFLLIPDKRYCFDHFLSESNLAHLVEAYLNDAKYHSIRSVIEHRALTTHNDSLRHWQNDHGSQYESLKMRFDAAIEEYRSTQGQYIDVHAWYFTVESFRRTMNELNSMFYIAFDLLRVYGPLYGMNEFWSILRKSGSSVEPL